MKQVAMRKRRLMSLILALGWCLTLMPLAPAWQDFGGSDLGQGQAIDFYGKPVRILKLFGQTRWGDCTPGRVTGAKIYHAAGVLVDRSSTPNHIYVADTGNSRILGFRSYGSPTADIVFGQPDEFSGAPNGDCNLGTHTRPSRASMCLMNIPENTNLAEQWMRLNFDVDAQGNLYVPDFHNNRVLIFRAPFSADTSNGQGDNVPDLVLGQADFTSNGINRGRGPNAPDAQSLYISFGGFDHVSARGVSVDATGNVWVEDTFNFRVLRFPPGATRADLVLGQPNFVTSNPMCDLTQAGLNSLCTPTLARLNPDTGELYVVDEYPGGFPARIVVFKPPFKNGMRAARVILPQQRLDGDYANGYRFTHAAGLVFNPVKTDDWIDETTKTHRYRDGVVWVHDRTRTLLLDGEGHILLAVGAPDLITTGGSDSAFARSGLSPETPFNLVWPGGMIGFDSDNNIYLADERWHRVARFALPYRVRQTPNGLALPLSNGGLFPGTLPNTVGPANLHADRVGVIAFRNQLIVRDHQRYMVWNDYLTRPDQRAADFFVGQSSGDQISQRNHILGRTMHAIDHRDRLWATGEHGRLMIYQLPLMADSKPLRELVPLYWADEPNKEVEYRCEQPIAFERRTGALWLFDSPRHRLLRVRNPDDWQGKLLVDVVIGQKNKTDRAINRGMSKPDAASFGDVSDIRFDNLGNLFVVDNAYECHLNGRITAFLAEDLAAIRTMFPDIQAKKVYVVDRFDETNICRASADRPHSPVSIAFNSRNEMVVGNDGYYSDLRTRHITQLYLYRRPLSKPTPDAVIELPLGAPGELTFDEHNNLIVQDHTWNKIWVINYDRDPAWLRPLR